MVAYTGRVICVVAAIIFDVYEHYSKRWLMPNVIKLQIDFGFGMKTCLGTGLNMLEPLELLDVIEGTKVD